MHIALEVGQQEDGDYDKTDGWRVTTLQLTPAWITEHVRDRSGALISTACGSGREPLARAFLKSGYASYIAPVETYYNADAGLIFTVNLFYFLLSEDRDYTPHIYSEEAAVESVLKVDPDFIWGPSVFRRYRVGKV